MARFSSRNTTIRFEDAADTGLTVGPGPGDFSHGATNAENTEKVRVMDRGKFDGHVETNDLEQDWSLTTQLKNEAQTDATAQRLQDFLRREGSFSGLVSVSSNPNIWAFRVIITQTTGGVTATRTLPHCLADHAFAEALEGNTLSINGTNNGPITVT
ncbi:MAG: hypothetical protein AAF602_12305 [Myxococcota bacterium]